MCNAVAAAVLGDATKAKYVPLSAQQRFLALQSGEIDMLVRNSTITLERDAGLGLQYAGVNFYDGQGFMVPKKLGVRPRQVGRAARSILMAIALSAWLLASVIASFIVACMSFFGVAFIGLVICYVGAQFGLDGDRPVGSLATSFLGAQVGAQQEMSAEQRQSVRHEHLPAQSARFFEFFGLGLMAIGLCGGLYYQL